MSNVNWSEKVVQMNQKLDDELENKIENILVTIQTMASEPLAPAVIIDEDDTFLEILIINVDEDDAVINTAILKKNIQSIGIIGGVEIEDINDSVIDNIFDLK
ncbi:MAG: hypothetical protein MJ232_01010 [archaeon]|nr:hypothetical protein [archaeon]